MQLGMRTAARRLAGGSRAVAVRPEAAAPPAVAPAAGSAVSSTRPVGAAVQRRAEDLAERADAAAYKVFGGSSDRACYTADSPILSQALNPSRPAPRRRSEETIVPAPRPAEPEPPKSLAELEQLPTTELKRMLAVRGVGLGDATEKAELVNWVQKHQDLPVKHRAARSEDAVHFVRDSAPATKSLAEFKEMPVKELRRFLHERGAGEGGNTEKSELVQWVYQHRDLPVLRQDDPRRERSDCRWRRGPGPGGDPYDMPRGKPDAEDPKQEQLEGAEQEKLEGGEETKLLEGSADTETPSSRWRWLWVPAGVGATLALGLIALAINDSQSAVGPEETDSTARVRH